MAVQAKRKNSSDVDSFSFSKGQKVYLAFKRLIDLGGSFVGILLFGLPMAVIAVVTRCTSKGPALYKQVRLGKDEKPFTMLKFRSMRADAPSIAPADMAPGEQEHLITKWGHFLRKTSLDELPQIINIVKGEMSIIGPRPALWNQFDLIEERDKYGANDVMPGLTGWAQINGRDELPIDVKARLDGEYVEKMGFLFDCKCFFKTFTSVLKHEGVVEGGTGAMKENAEKEN